MSKKYNKTFTNLKTVVNDTSILNAQKILVNTSSDNVTERTNIVDYIGDSVDKLKEKINSRVDDLEQNTVILNTKVEKLYDTYDSYDTLDFAYGIELGHCDTSSFRLGYNHTPNGIIRKVSLYARNTSGNNYDCYTDGCYLLVQKYNKETSELISSIRSTNKVVVQRNNTSTPLLNTWEFEGFDSCDEGEVLKFIPTSGDTQIANYYIGIAVDSNHTHTDCNVGGDTFVDGVNTTPLGEGNKWVAYVQFEGDFYRESDFKTHPNNSSKHLKSIERPVIESLYTTTTGEIWNNNINNDSLGNASCKGFKLERPYIANCVFNEMRWTTTSGTEDCTCYLKVTLNDTRGKEICSYFSNNTESFNSTGLKSFRFDEDIEITDKIGSITCEISLDGINVVTTESKRIRVASVGTSANNTTDGSELTNANIIVHVIFYGNIPTSLLTSHIGDDTHLTTAQKNAITDYLSHVGNNTHLTETDRELLDNLANGYVENLYTNSVNILEEGETISTPTSVTVTIDEITLDANVTAQNRMARAILVMEEDETVQWLSSDGTVVTLTKLQLKQALKTALGNEINNWIGA